MKRFVLGFISQLIVLFCLLYSIGFSYASPSPDQKLCYGSECESLQIPAIQQQNHRIELAMNNSNLDLADYMLIQEALAKLGFFNGRIDGKSQLPTRNALYKFATINGFPEIGRGKNDLFTKAVLEKLFLEAGDISKSPNVLIRKVSLKKSVFAKKRKFECTKIAGLQICAVPQNYDLSKNSPGHEYLISSSLYKALGQTDNFNNINATVCVSTDTDDWLSFDMSGLVDRGLDANSDTVFESNSELLNRIRRNGCDIVVLNQSLWSILYSNNEDYDGPFIDFSKKSKNGLYPVSIKKNKRNNKIDLSEVRSKLFDTCYERGNRGATYYDCLCMVEEFEKRQRYSTAGIESTSQLFNSFLVRAPVHDRNKKITDKGRRSACAKTGYIWEKARKLCKEATVAESIKAKGSEKLEEFAQCCSKKAIEVFQVVGSNSNFSLSGPWGDRHVNAEAYGLNMCFPQFTR